MKQIIIIIAIILASSSAFSQAYLQMGAGYSTTNHPTAELAAGYKVGSVLIQAGYIAHISRDVAAGNIINARLGTRLGNLWFLEPSAGYAYMLRSSEQKELNTLGFIGSLYAGKTINSGSLLLGGNYTKDAFIMNLVIRYNF